MTEFFTRTGAPVTTVLMHGKKPMANVFHACGRCGGLGGSDQWKHTGWTCFQCNGNKGTMKLVPVYTAAELAVLNAKRDAKRAIKAAAVALKVAEATAAHAAVADEFKAAHADLIEAATGLAARSEFLTDLVGRLAHYVWTPGQIEAVTKAVARIKAEDVAKAGSEYVGKVGERLKLAVTVERVFSGDRPCFNAPWLRETFHIVTMRDAAGNTFVTKGKFYAEKGAALNIKGTVKEHTEYRGEKQTTLQRVLEVA